MNPKQLFYNQHDYNIQTRILKAKIFLSKILQLPISKIRFLATKDFYNPNDIFTLRLDFEKYPPGAHEMFFIEMITYRYGQELQHSTRYPNCLLIRELSLEQLEYYIECNLAA